MSRLSVGFVVWALAVCLLGGDTLAAQAPSEALTLISPDGRRSLPTIQDGERDLVALRDVVEVFGLRLQGDTRGATTTLSYRDQAIILTADQRVVSVGGQLVSLRAPIRLRDGQWFVPLDFLSRALGSVAEQTIELRPRSRLLLVGGVRVPEVSGRYRTRGAGAQVNLEIIPEVPHRVSREPGRLVLTFEADALDVRRLPTVQDALVTGIAASPSTSTITVDLGPDLDSFEVSRRPLRRVGTELVIDLRAVPPVTDTNSDPAGSDTGPAAVAAGVAVDPLPDLTARPTVRVVAIDAGHGGEDNGTRGQEDTLEKDITLAVTRRLREAIVSRLGLRVVVTRDQDQTVGLDARAAVANNNKADLFISLHVNASVRAAATGAEVFYLSVDEYGDEARELAEREAQVVPVLGGRTRAIDLVEWEMAQVRYLDQSARLADIVHSELGRRVPMSSRGVQDAPFRVLVGANMPAVLVEMGFISNPNDERRLAGATFQNAVVDALIASILRFRDYLEREAALAESVASADPTAEPAAGRERDR